MSEEILVDVNSFETRVALVVDGALKELHLERPGAYSLRGNLYWGRVDRVVPAVQAAFVDIGIGRPGFLHVRDLHGVRTEPGVDAPEIQSLIRAGQRLMVQVSKDPLNGKAARLTTNLALAARTVVLLPMDSHVAVSARIVDENERDRLKTLVERERDQLGLRYGYIARTASQTATAEQVRADLSYLDRLWRRLSQRSGVRPGEQPAAGEPTRMPGSAGDSCLVFEELPVPTRVVRDVAGPTTDAIVVNHHATFDRLSEYVGCHLPEFGNKINHYDSRTPLFEARGVEAAIERALDKRVPLPCGGFLAIEQTEAMTTIDVNSGTFVESTSLESTAFKTNLEAAQSIPVQLRVRNIGGIIVVDFIDMAEDEHRSAVMATLVAGAAEDPAPFRASGFSELGLVEISRRRTRASLQHQLCDPCDACTGRAFARSPQSACYDIFRAVRRHFSITPLSITPRQPADRRRETPDDEYLVRASQPVVDRLLDEEAVYLAALSREVERPIRLQVEPGYAADQFDLVAR